MTVWWWRNIDFHATCTCISMCDSFLCSHLVWASIAEWMFHFRYRAKTNSFFYAYANDVKKRRIMAETNTKNMSNLNLFLSIASKHRLSLIHTRNPCRPFSSIHVYWACFFQILKQQLCVYPRLGIEPIHTHWTWPFTQIFVSWRWSPWIFHNFFIVDLCI